MTVLLGARENWNLRNWVVLQDINSSVVSNPKESKLYRCLCSWRKGQELKSQKSRKVLTEPFNSSWNNTAHKESLNMEEKNPFLSTPQAVSWKISVKIQMQHEQGGKWQKTIRCLLKNKQSKLHHCRLQSEPSMALFISWCSRPQNTCCGRGEQLSHYTAEVWF